MNISNSNSYAYVQVEEFSEIFTTLNLWYHDKIN